MRILAVVQARMTSTRLYGKVLQDLAGETVLGWVVRAARAIPGVDGVVVATSTQGSDDAIAKWCLANAVGCHRGPEDDVLERYALVIQAEFPDVIIRLTADCPFLDPQVCGQMLRLFVTAHADYASNFDPPSWPDGLDCEAMSADSLLQVAKVAVRPSDREHVTPYFRSHRSEFQVENLACPIPGLGGERWTVDTESDLAFLRAVAERLPYEVRPPSFLEILDVLDREPELRSINGGQQRNEGFIKSMTAETLDVDRQFERTTLALERAEKVIPLGSQTFSKSRIQYPVGDAPLFVTHGDGCRVWDVDGNEYIDLVSGLLPVVLGYRDPDVDWAIRRQLMQGISFSLATELEAELAERIVEEVPCAEQVRFGKNGTDATSAAIRLARAITGRDRVMTCGYHGWQDWYIGQTSRNRGVPPVVRELTTPVQFNELEAIVTEIGKHPGEYAALILEPMNVADPRPGFLEELKEVLNAEGALLIFDEIITGFRYSLGGAQKIFGVTPDLAALGKAMANGMPISAVVGAGHHMEMMEEVFFSGTFGGETLSIAAAISVIDKMRREPVIETLYGVGDRLAQGAQRRIEKYELGQALTLLGRSPWKLLAYGDHPGGGKDVVKTIFVREMIRAGVLINASHNVNYAIKPSDESKILAAYDHALGVLSRELSTGDAEDRLKGRVIQPVFKVR